MTYVICFMLLSHVACFGQPTLKSDTIWKSTTADLRAVTALRAYDDTVVLATTRLKDHDEPLQHMSVNDGDPFLLVPLLHVPSTLRYPMVGIDLMGMYEVDDTTSVVWTQRGFRDEKRDTIRTGMLNIYSAMLNANSLRPHPTERGLYSVVAERRNGSEIACQALLHHTVGEEWSVLRLPLPDGAPVDKLFLQYDYQDPTQLYVHAEVDDSHPLGGWLHLSTKDGGRTTTATQPLDNVGGVGIFGEATGITNQPSTGPRVEDVLLVDLEARTESALNFRDAIIRSLLPAFDSTRMQLKLLWNWGISPSNDVVGIACHHEAPDLIALSISVDTLIGSTWAKQLAIVLTTDRGRTWSWVSTPSLDTDRAEPTHMVINPVNRTLFYAYRRYNGATKEVYETGVVRIRAPKPLSVHEEHRPLTESNNHVSMATVYPNPTTGRFTLMYGAGMGLATIQLVDNVGRVRELGPCTTIAADRCEIDCSQLSAGVYTVHATDGHRSVMSYVVIQP